jgi:hypothetical protein
MEQLQIIFYHSHGIIVFRAEGEQFQYVQCWAGNYIFLRYSPFIDENYNAQLSY